MNIWQFLDKTLDRLPGWPNGRGLVGLATFSLTVMVLWMLKEDTSLREDEFFKIIATAIVLTGFINGVVAFFFSQNQLNSEASQNTRAAFDVMGKQAEATKEAARTLPQGGGVSAGAAADAVADAASDEAARFRGDDNA